MVWQAGCPRPSPQLWFIYGSAHTVLNPRTVLCSCAVHTVEMPGDRELPLIQCLQVTLYVEHWISFESFHWLTIYWVRMMADFELVFQNWGLDLVPSRMMGDLGSAIRRNFLHFWPSYVSNIYFANETLSITAFSVTENVTFSKEKTIMEINRRFWPSRVKFCIFPCDVLPFPRTEDRQYFFF